MKQFLALFLVLFHLSVSAQIVLVDQNKDTVIITQRTKDSTITIRTTSTDIVRKPYQVPTTPTNPVPVKSYLTLPVSDPLVINGQSNVVIDGRRFENSPGVAIYIKNSKNITVKNCFINRTTLEAIVVEGSQNVLVENCLINNAQTGVYALSSQGVQVINNQGVNFRQRGSGGRGQFAQFNGVTGAGNKINNNNIENFLGESDPEDVISLFKSSGTATSPIEVKNNKIRGGGPSASGGGIMLGDYGGSYQVAENNVLLDPGQYGMAIAGGNNISIIGNKIFAKQQPFTNNPLYMWAQQGAACGTNTVRNNRVNWTDKSGRKNGGWDAGNCGGSTFEYPSQNLTVADLGLPAHLITMITPEELEKIRK